MAPRKLFSSELKTKLAEHTANYTHNRDRAQSLSLYARQAAEFAWNICDIFKDVVELAQTIEDLDDVCRRIKSSLGDVVTLQNGSFEEKKAELETWVEKRRKKESATARRLRKAD